MYAALSLDWTTGPERGRLDAPQVGDTEPTILVVEDEFLVRLGVTEYLRDRGYRVVEARTGEEAQAILRSGELVELLFTDIHLGPGINGFALAAWTRETFGDIRIILTSAVCRKTQIASDLCDGPLLTKPYAYERLAERIRILLGTLDKRGDR